MQLSKRLKAVADFVTKGNRVADIGCDHAYTSIYLMENQIASHVIAMDINQGPLERANENIQSAGLESKIETRLSNGAQKLEQDEVDTILIAGMGGNLMVNILSNSRPIVNKVTELILQPQSEIFLVRKYLHDIGFLIVDETMLLEEGKYYVVIQARNNANDSKEVYQREVYDLYGKLLLENKNEVLKEWLEKEYQTTTLIVEQLKEQASDNARERIKELNLKLKYIVEGMSFYE